MLLVQKYWNMKCQTVVIGLQIASESGSGHETGAIHQILIYTWHIVRARTDSTEVCAEGERVMRQQGREVEMKLKHVAAALLHKPTKPVFPATPQRWGESTRNSSSIYI